MSQIEVHRFLLKQLSFARRLQAEDRRNEMDWWKSRIQALEIERQRIFENTVPFEQLAVADQPEEVRS